jgi:hypothetical protein
MSRTEETAARRRRRDDELDLSLSLQLGVPADKMDAQYQYRWINEGEHSRRLTALTVRDDWDVVRSKDIGREGDEPVRHAVGTQKNGEPHYAYLCRKRKEFVEEDAKRKHRITEERTAALRRGQTGAGTLNAGKDGAYIPDEGIAIS